MAVGIWGNFLPAVGWTTSTFPHKTAEWGIHSALFVRLWTRENTPLGSHFVMDVVTWGVLILGW